jgi:hypothetical protein
MMSAALLALETSIDAFLYFGSVYIPMKRAGLWKHMVCLEISWVESWGDLNR